MRLQISSATLSNGAPGSSLLSTFVHMNADSPDLLGGGAEYNSASKQNFQGKTRARTSETKEIRFHSPHGWRQSCFLANGILILVLRVGTSHLLLETLAIAVQQLELLLFLFLMLSLHHENNSDTRNGHRGDAPAYWRKPEAEEAGFQPSVSLVTY